MLGERPRARRPREHARQVEHAHAGQRALSLTKRHRRCVIDLLQFDHGLRCQQRTLWMREPLIGRAAGGRAQSLHGERIFELEGAAPSHGSGDLFSTGIGGQTEFGQDARTIGEASVQMNVAPVTTLEDRGNSRHAPLRRFAAGTFDAQQREAVQRSRRVPHVDGQALPLASTHAPDALSILAHERECRGSSFAHMERRREHRILACHLDIGLGGKFESGECRGSFDSAAFHVAYDNRRRHSGRGLPASAATTTGPAHDGSFEYLQPRSRISHPAPLAVRMPCTEN